MDNGILNLFLDDKRTLLLENIVAINLYRQHKEELYYLKGNKVDIDFYLSNTNTAIQVAYSLNDVETYDREVNNLVEFARLNQKKTKLIIITYEEKQNINIDGISISVIPLKEFLLS